MSSHGPRYLRQKHEAYYTPPSAVRVLFDVLPIAALWRYTVWECAAGAGHIAREFAPFNDVLATDIAPAQHQVFPVKPLDFLTCAHPSMKRCAIITNPPYGPANALAIAFLTRALDIAFIHSGFVAMLLPFEFDAAGSRDEMVGGHPAFAAKITCARRIRWLNLEQKKAGPMSHHSWFMWSFDRALRKRLQAQPMRTI